jgi:hypothetical protein
MNTIDFIIALFCRVDDQMQSLTKHTQAKLYPSEVVTLAMLFTLKGVGERAFYRWLVRDYLDLFPQLPERTRLFRLFKIHQDWTERFLAAPNVLGVADSYGTIVRFIRFEKVAAPDRLAKRASLIIVGLSAVNSACCSISGAW